MQLNRDQTHQLGRTLHTIETLAPPTSTPSSPHHPPHPTSPPTPRQDPHLWQYHRVQRHRPPRESDLTYTAALTAQIATADLTRIDPARPIVIHKENTND